MSDTPQGKATIVAELGGAGWSVSDYLLGLLVLIGSFTANTAPFWLPMSRLVSGETS